MRLILIFVLFQATFAVPQSAPAPPQSPSPNTVGSLTPDQRATVLRLANLEKNFGKSMNSLGVELSMKEIDRSRAEDRTFVHYALYANGLPKKSIYTLFQVQISGSIIKNMEGVTLNAEGRAICAGRPDTCTGDGPNDPIDLMVYGGKGEPKRFGLMSDDEAHLKGFVEVVPFPNDATDKGCRIESIIGTPNAELIYIRGNGFEPNSELIVDSQSYDEKHHDIAKAAADGSYFSAIMPSVVGRKSGTTAVEVKAKNCNPKLTFSWGEGTYHLE